jgi:small ligand-binding sensory domain FIST
MNKFREIGEQLKNMLFGKSEVKNRISENTVRMILGDVTTLYAEFRKAKGAGALFFNPSNSEASQYMTVSEIAKDMALAEEMLNDSLADCLSQLINVIDKEKETDAPVVVMVAPFGLSVHVIDLDKVDQLIKEYSEDALRR